MRYNIYAIVMVKHNLLITNIDNCWCSVQNKGTVIEDHITLKYDVISVPFNEAIKINRC